MSQALDEFVASVDSLAAYLQYQKDSQLYFRKGLGRYTGNSTFEKEFREFVNSSLGKSSILEIKVYSYQNAIISLYGYLERYVEERVVEYLNSITDVCQEYKFIPSRIKKNHLRLSLELISKIQKVRGLSVGERKASLCTAVNNMNDFLSEKSKFEINYDAFIVHSANFRYDSIHEVFARVGIEGISKKCLNEKKFVNALCQKHNIEGISNQKILVSLLMSELDDLAQRRNEIAHGARVDDIQSTDITISRIDLVKAYVLAMDQIVTKSFEQYAFTVTPNLSLGKATKVFPMLNVFGFVKLELLEQSDACRRISEGDMLFAVNSNASQKILSGRIISLHVAGVQQSTIAVPSTKNATIGVNFNISQNFEKRVVYVVPLS